MKRLKNDSNSQISPSKELNFEQALKRIEEIINRLETGELGLEESLLLFEEGIQLTRLCNKKLKIAERRIEILTKNERGDFETLPAGLDGGN